MARMGDKEFSIRHQLIQLKRDRNRLVRIKERTDNDLAETRVAIKSLRASLDEIEMEKKAARSKKKAPAKKKAPVKKKAAAPKKTTDADAVYVPEEKVSEVKVDADSMKAIEDSVEVEEKKPVEKKTPTKEKEGDEDKNPT